MNDDPYAAVMRKESRSPLLVALALSTLLMGAVLLMWSRGWLKFDSRPASAKEAHTPEVATTTCQQAADRYVSCVGEMLGPSAKEMAASKRDIESCARDSKTVAMYEQCLPKTGCRAFMDCLTDYAAKTAP